jgi:hypothetical protein
LPNVGVKLFTTFQGLGGTNMRPRDWFSVGTRLIGVYTFVRAFAYFSILVEGFLFDSTGSVAGVRNQQANALMAVFHASLAFVLVFGAEAITRVVFKEQMPGGDHTDAETDSE